MFILKGSNCHFCDLNHDIVACSRCAGFLFQKPGSFGVTTQWCKTVEWQSCGWKHLVIKGGQRGNGQIKPSCQDVCVCSDAFLLATMVK